MARNPISVLVTGRYLPDYNRNQIILAGLKNLGVKVLEFPYKKKNRKAKLQIRQYDRQADFIYLPSFTHLDVAFVKRHTTKPLIFDPLISKYMTKVHDYKKLSRYSIRALKNYFKDNIMMKRADAVIADTYQHLAYYQQVIKIDAHKLSVVPVGVDIHKFYPAQPRTPHQHFKVGFYGSYIPLHGIEKIIDAARLLEKEEDITFEIIGNGSTEKKIRKKLTEHPLQNVQLTHTVDYHALNDAINAFDLCLGIFGESIKADMVIPNKVYHYAACGKCIITKDTPAIREVFTDQTNIVLCQGDPEDLAAKIMFVKATPPFREKIESNALSLIQREYNQDVIAQKLLNVYQQKFGANSEGKVHA